MPQVYLRLLVSAALLLPTGVCVSVHAQQEQEERRLEVDSCTSGARVSAGDGGHWLRML